MRARSKPKLRSGGRLDDLSVTRSSCRNSLSAVCGRWRRKVLLLLLLRVLDRRCRERRFKHVRRAGGRSGKALHSVPIPVQRDLLLPGSEDRQRKSATTSVVKVHGHITKLKDSGWMGGTHLKYRRFSSSIRTRLR